MKMTKVITEGEFNALYPRLLEEENPLTMSEAIGFLKALNNVYDSPEWVEKYLFRILFSMVAMGD